MRRKVLLVVLGFGTVLGYACALGSHHRHDRHRAWKEEVADLCVTAAERQWRGAAAQRGEQAAGVKP